MLPHSNLMEITYKSPWQIIAAEFRPLWLLWTLYIFTQHPTNLGKSILTENSTKSLLDSSMKMKGKGFLQCMYEFVFYRIGFGVLFWFPKTDFVLLVSFIPFLVFGHFWRPSYKNTKILRNLCLHFVRQDGQDGKNGKKIKQLKWLKYQISKDEDMGWTLQSFRLILDITLKFCIPNW